MVTELKEPESEAMVPRGDVDMLMVEAVRSGNIEVMERVMAIRRELKAEAAREAFFDSLAAFQAECPVLKKNKWVLSEAGNKLYAYAPLDSIVKQLGGLISKHGFSYTIKSKIEEPDDHNPLGRVTAVCRVLHSAGHTEESPFTIPIKEATRFTNAAQQAGTARSYAKRYAFCDALGIMTEDEDTDGRISPEDARKARHPVSQPRSTPTAQKAAQRANGAQAERVQLEPAGPDDERIDSNTIKGLTKSMEHASLGMSDFKKRFARLNGLEDVKKGDIRVVLSWIANPVER
jgi:hypothetical protein